MKYQVWEFIDYEGWSLSDFANLKDAVAYAIGRGKNIKITKSVEYDIDVKELAVTEK